MHLTIFKCPCGSQENYDVCCKPYVSQKQLPPNPEALMRSRYTAFTQANIDYIRATMDGNALLGFEASKTQAFAKKVTWIGLHVINRYFENEFTGFVEFEAYFLEHDRLKCIHELSTFLLKNGQWYYVEGNHLPPTVKEHLIAKNASCPCGSLRKYKNCHGSP